MATRFNGNCPANVSRDAKYAVRSKANGFVCALTYRTATGEKWYASTEEHPELVEAVNKVKLAMGGAPGGAFYLNEYRQIVVPAGKGAEYFLAGEYHQPLVFTFEDKVLSGEPRTLDGQPVTPGKEWVGPRPGIPYVLKAGGRDVYYDRSPRPNVSERVSLSAAVGADKAATTAEIVRQAKGFGGGRFYINEWRALFAPISTGDEWKYLYLGRLDPDDPWFPKPHS